MTDAYHQAHHIIKQHINAGTDDILLFAGFGMTAVINKFQRLLNDRFGIQTRGGCQCAGTYGHVLLHIDDKQSKEITNRIDKGDLSGKPGWVRISLHPTMTESEVRYIAAAVNAIMQNQADWGRDYRLNPETGDFEHPGYSRASIDLKSTFITA
ncbi:MAG: hypothetical protein WC703_08640 [Candidatus Neomarinimicrobiota bacterium]